MNKLFLLILLLFVISASNLFAQSGKPKIITGGVVNGKAITLVKPEYPKDARAAGDEGIVNVQVKIDEKGDVIFAEAVSGPMSLRKPAEEAALASKFSPTYLKESAVKINGVIVYNFASEKSKTIRKNSIGGGVLNGKAIKLPPPEYPSAAKAIGADGTVNVQVNIDEKGNVIFAEAVSGHPLLRKSCEESALRAKFTPTYLKGKPIKVIGVVVYNFATSKK